MAAYETYSLDDPGAQPAKPVVLVCFGLIVATVVYLAASYVHGTWILAPDDRPIAADFVTIWAAGHMAQAGHAASAYDWTALRSVDAGVTGRPFVGYLGWPYPPTFLFCAVLLSLLPYVGAFIFWISSTFVAYLVAIRAIVGNRIGYFLGAAFPAVLANFVVGQNGFLSAGLIGGAIFLIERQPVYAGVLLGLLTYKPHLAALFPIVLVASGRWKVLISAGITAAVVMALSWAAFGGESWVAFFSGIKHALGSDALTDQGKLQSAFGLVLLLCGSKQLAWTVQIAIALFAAISISAFWRRRASYELKAAALGVGVLLLPSHLLTYDLVILAVPLAFLFRLGNTYGFLRYEMLGIGLVCLLILVFPFVQAPVGFVAVLIVAALVMRRALSAAVHPERPTALPALSARATS
ncbi:MAG TPA: glycosyltransferase family 87 protein [Xanthobacteraceae bacterium]|jgi:hypothetical protein|nr:glycosyltransferase family 87 protein [Xanthobacteraceae bacterium]